ncbi:MAG: pilus assembly protein PilM [Planctomycetota bacterium]
MSPLFKTQTTLAIEINAEVIKIAHLKAGSQPELLSFASNDIRASDDDQIIEFIRNFTTLNKIKTPNVISVIPGRFTITKNIELPSTDPAEIRQIIQLQASRHSPYSRDEIVIDYIPIGVFKGGYTRILLVIVNRDHIKKNMDIIERAGLRVKKVVLSTETMSQWYTEQSDKPVGMLHIDSGNMDFSVVHNGKPVFLRIITLGANQLIYDHDKYIQKCQEEIRHSLEAYQTENLGQISQLIVTGATEKADFGNIVRDATGILPKLEPWSGLIQIAKEAEEQKKATAPDVSFHAVITAGLKYGKTRIDLTPEEVKLQQSMAEKSRDVIKLGTLIIIILVLITIIFGQKIWIKTSFNNKLKEYYDQHHDKAVELREKHKKTVAVDSYLRQQKMPLESLAELQKLTPDTIYFETTTYEYGRDKRRMIIRGVANSNNDVTLLRDQMEKSSYFNKVDIKSMVLTPVKDGSIMKEVINFEIACGFKDAKTEPVK